MRRFVTQGMLWMSVLFFSPPSAEAQGDLFFDEIDVRLVEIEVTVRDGEGRPVTGLTRDDFELRQGRKRLPVTHFAAFEGGRRVAPRPVAGPGGRPWTVEDRLNLVVYVDRAYLEPGEVDGVLEAVDYFLRSALRPRDRAMLVEADPGLRIVHPFTSVPEILVDALRRLPARPVRSRSSADFPRLLNEIERVVRRGADIPALSGDEHPMMLKAEIESFAGEVYEELRGTTHQLHRLIPALAGLPGRKEVLYVGGALPTNTGQQLYSAWRTAFGPNSAYSRQRNARDDSFSRLDNSSPQGPISTADTDELFRAVARRANASGVRLHVLDASGLRRSDAYVSSRGATLTERGGGTSFGDRVDIERRLGNPQVLKNMAEETGGRALIHSRTFREALDGVASDLGSYYVLAFQPAEGPGELRELKVKLKGSKRGLELRHRRAYRSRGRDGVAADRAVSALILGVTHDPLGIELIASPPEILEDGSARLPLIVVFPIDGLVLIRDGGEHRGQVSLYLTSGDLERGAAQVQKAVVPLRFDEAQLAGARGRHVEYKLELPMVAGSRRVAVALRDDLRPLMSTAVLELGGLEPAGP